MTDEYSKSGKNIPEMPSERMFVVIPHNNITLLCCCFGAML
ncbi:hypothetical protein EUBSIR_01516 [[Eubacterium] siraeum DSM 15702]|uniref:Uncharacterized protein n=1 Tax=[Eubacterium] siraeum DSM 15702 TaxID=428128 RepID=B0MNV9_9FIRM|nr:hypothetical protein EUBSIR_01516 [[Eubacterium] siraeum DSM 15702]